MEKTEIKKLYQKMSRQLKKQGLNYTCVMNTRQQQLGTATICFASVIDFEYLLRRSEANLADTDGTEKEVREHARDIVKSIEMYRKWAADDKSSNTEYWKQLVADYDAGKYEDRVRREVIERKQGFAESRRKELKERGTVEQQRVKVKERYENLKNRTPLILTKLYFFFYYKHSDNIDKKK